MKQPLLYNTIGRDYNLTRRADPYLTSRLLYWLAPQPTGLYVDIGCGTGNYTVRLAENEVNMWGVDPSETMLTQAKQQSVQARTNRVTWLIGTADAIPADNHCFDGAIATLTIHHWPDLANAFGELHRVLKPANRLVIFTALPEQMQGYWLNYYFPEMLRDSIRQMPSLDRIRQAAVGFTLVKTEPYFIQSDLSDLFLYAGKCRPEIYFNPMVRQGISSFSALAHTIEVERGLAQLRADVATGSFQGVKQAFNNQVGDYLLIIMSRN